MKEQKTQKKRHKRRSRVGIVISDKMNKTRIVRVVALVRHPLYNKIIKKIGKFKAHDENNTSKAGDKVRINEMRPLSKDKRWRISEILKSEHDAKETRT